MENFIRYLNTNNVAANYWASGKRWSGNPLSVYPLAQNDRPQMSVLQQFIAGVPYEEKPIIAASTISGTNTSGATTANTNSSSTESVNNVPVIERTPVPTLPPPPPESFLFLPGTVLLPQPNGGLYKPTLKQMPTDTGVRVAKYKNN
jgi:endoglucanase